VERGESLVIVNTELRLESVLVGGRAGTIAYQHREYEEAGQAAPWRSDLSPGRRVLAFLKRTRDGAARAAFEETDPGFAIKALSDRERSAYVARLHALARLEGGDHDGADPDAIVEWLVTTAEDPLTRGEGTEELTWALDDLDEMATRSGRPREQIAAEVREAVQRERDESRAARALPAAVLGPFLTAEQMDRLTRALQSTRTLSDADRQLVFLVLRWDRDRAVDWLADRLLDVDPPDGGPDLWWLHQLATRLDDAELAAIVERATRRFEAITSPAQGDELAATDRSAAQLKELGGDVWREAADALARRR
jgi:hypothetical protein